MKHAVELLQYSDTHEFNAPEGVQIVQVDNTTNLPADPTCETDTYPAAFLDGTVPTASCSHPGGADKRNFFQKILASAIKSPEVENELSRLKRSWLRYRGSEALGAPDRSVYGDKSVCCWADIRGRLSISSVRRLRTMGIFSNTLPVKAAGTSSCKLWRVRSFWRTKRMKSAKSAAAW